MSRMIPHPLLSAFLVLIWMLLTRFSLGHLVLGSAIALVAGWAMSALHPARPRIRRWRVIPGLLTFLFADIIRSNIAVTRLILTEGRSGRTSGLIIIPLQLRDANALATLAVILTATPGTAWLEYASETGHLTLHIFDAREAEHYRDVIRDRYEPMLMEIFE